MGKKQNVRKEPLKVRIRSLNENKLNRINSELPVMQGDWTPVLNGPLDQAYDIFVETMIAALNKIAPLKQIVIPFKKIIHNKWVTPGIRFCFQKK